ncbi:histone deacetylase 7-like isoform X2 [Leptidea sinapis]|uniref:histone deacetylase 7-like isoform X2 n=1 Tax=Leptidea sinapis TaxID=189913 RepID=UPI0021C404C7|nr:histone deacetylase 7-like isoform X2 [Leptidea sinapis]
MSANPTPVTAEEMAHESSAAGGGTERSLQQPASPPLAPRLPADTSFHHQIMQNHSPRKSHIAERAKQSLENSFLLQLKKQQQLQQEILLQHFQRQQQQLAEQHEQQIRHHLKLWEQQKAMEEAALREAREAREARERHERERDRAELLRKKDKLEPCAAASASTQVKQKLQEFLKKKQAAATANGTLPGSPYRNWGIVKSSSGESITSPGATSVAHPYRLPAPPAPSTAPSAADYPLRKTASEPNMLKVRLKARVIERRASPLARRPLARRHKSRNCESGSPPAVCAAPIREEEESAHSPELLFSSPSMPNISLGLPHVPHPSHVPHASYVPHAPRPLAPPGSASLPPVCEAEAYCGVDGVSAVASGLSARLAKRPLGRTHSAPLPLGDPALHAPHPLHPLPPTAHHYLRDQIRKTVLTRAHDAAAAQLREEEGEVIDLTSRRPPAAAAAAAAAGAAPAGGAAPLARALSSPLVGARPPPTGLAYDPLMLKHGCSCGAHAPTHPEHGGRLQSVWARLCETGLAARTERTRPRKATFDELQAVHSEAHVHAFGGRSRDAGGGGAVRLVRLACGGLGVDADTAWSEAHTPAAARTAAGAVLDLALRTARGDLRNGFAVVRPPGHHAEANQAMGFCFFNNVAVAARLLQTRLRLQRILIVDWDVHHGNGTQQMFYEDPRVLYVSLHRHDDGNFFPGTGAAGECGAGPGLGYTVNIPWPGHPPLADAEYLAAFRTIVMPIAKEYGPEIVLVSCGFDAAAGHPAPMGGYRVSAACFAHMTRDLMTLAGGRVVLSLEGGYDLAAMCDCAQECVRALLGEPGAAPAPDELRRPPAPHAQAALAAALAVHAPHWPALRRHAPLLALSALDAAAGAPDCDAADTAAAMATLSMHHPAALSRSESSRSVPEEPMEQDDLK